MFHFPQLILEAPNKQNRALHGSVFDSYHRGPEFESSFFRGSVLLQDTSELNPSAGET